MKNFQLLIENECQQSVILKWAKSKGLDMCLGEEGYTFRDFPYFCVRFDCQSLGGNCHEIKERGPLISWEAFLDHVISGTPIVDPTIIGSRELKIGEFGRITEGRYKDCVIVRTYDSFVVVRGSKNYAAFRTVWDQLDLRIRRTKGEFREEK